MSIEDGVQALEDGAATAKNNRGTLGQRLRRLLKPAPTLGPPIHPALLEQAQARAEARQNRFADRITAFAGSMAFVYIHIVWFGCWIGFRVERYPFGLLTMIVSLEAIFLSTFVLISQNRADANRQVVADQQWTTVQAEEEQNVELLDLSRQILSLTEEVHAIARSLASPKDDRSRRCHRTAFAPSLMGNTSSNKAGVEDRAPAQDPNSSTKKRSADL